MSWVAKMICPSLGFFDGSLNCLTTWLASMGCRLRSSSSTINTPPRWSVRRIGKAIRASVCVPPDSSDNGSQASSVSVEWCRTSTRALLRLRWSSSCSTFKSTMPTSAAPSRVRSISMPTPAASSGSSVGNSDACRAAASFSSMRDSQNSNGGSSWPRRARAAFSTKALLNHRYTGPSCV